MDHGRPCKCPPGAVQRYQARISGPLRDRFDMQLELLRVSAAKARAEPSGPTSAELRAQVLRAREVQSARAAALGIRAQTNARLAGAALRRAAALDAGGERVLRGWADLHELSARAIAKILRLARTLADLVGAERVLADHVGEVVQHHGRMALGAVEAMCA